VSRSERELYAMEMSSKCVPKIHPILRKRIKAKIHLIVGNGKFLLVHGP
jgi:hypothetical protein